MTADSFSALAQLDKISGASQSRVAQAFRGRAFDNATASQLLALRDEVEAMCKDAEPLALNLANAQTVHDLLTARRTGRLQIAVTWQQA